MGRITRDGFIDGHSQGLGIGLEMETKQALLDMAYNLGVGGLGKFSQLKEAVNRQDWATAAECCNRRTSRAERNDWTREMFLAAAQLEGGAVE